MNCFQWNDLSIPLHAGQVLHMILPQGLQYILVLSSKLYYSRFFLFLSCLFHFSFTSPPILLIVSLWADFSSLAKDAALQFELMHAVLPVKRLTK